MSLSSLRIALGIVVAMLGNSALACSFVIAFNTQFETGASLPASEVRRLAEWLIDSPGKYENQRSSTSSCMPHPAGVSQAWHTGGHPICNIG